jgi:hypothetical protein
MKSTIKTVENDFKADTKEIGVDTSTTQLVPGYSDEKMLIGAQTRGSAGGRTYCTAFDLNATGDKTITGCPFAPTSVRVDGFNGYTGFITASAGFSNGTVTAMAGAWDGDQESSNTYLVRLRNGSSVVTHEATLSSFTADGCVINFSTASATASFMVTLFG